MAVVGTLSLTPDGSVGNAYAQNSAGALAPIVCHPRSTDAKAPHPLIIWNHGRAHSAAEYKRASVAWRKMCDIKAASTNAIVYMPVRPDLSGPEHIPAELEMVMTAIDAAKSMPGVDPSRIALMGHSRGGLLSLMAATRRSDIAALILTATPDIPPYGVQAAARVSTLSAPVLLMAEKSDDEGGLEGYRLFSDALRHANKDHRAILFDRGGGHGLFRTRDYWWRDFEAFLVETIKITPSRNWRANLPLDTSAQSETKGEGIEARPQADPARRSKGRGP
jgi:acetyl esterase/lipase